ncbi:hypothetical protein PV08_09767 [Exophiala spinifera]|uniref:Zinc finger Mcm10/DnaG-type domain-containing protein n=1 Tax=Exophiala spinifera TaxID=91928 RepID=A0A0D2B1H9_9EURO|nr:uncharacterized protein PV08_09767 [Exophiala spinifera]KIW12490.1 hypothetical protein PV08_09767 [Exophiala spinifera]
MSHDASWPPVSPHAALLSSPSGRKKYEAHRNGQSPIKRSGTASSLVDRLRAVRSGHDRSSQREDMEDDAEEDEETLQLKLAAIEAKLKLKRLQQTKARAGDPGNSSRPSSSQGVGSTTSNALSSFQGPISRSAQVEVQKSPTRRPQPSSQPKSPSRVLLGIDKGVRGADVSLRRANTTAGVSHKTEVSGRIERSSSRSSAFSARLAASTENRKTFSERMAEARERETSHEQRRNRQRSKVFDIDENEIEKHRALAQDSTSALAQPRAHSRPQQPEYSRSDIINASDERQLKKSRTLPDLRQTSSPQLPGATDDVHPQGDASLFEGFSGLHLTSRILPHSFLRRTLPTDRFTILRIPDLLKTVKSPSFDLPETVVDYAIFGIIASKSSPMDQKAPQPDSTTVGESDWHRQWDDGSQNSRRFMALTLTDLKWTVDLYLFGTALPRYHRLSPGTLVAILNPGIMPPKRGKTDTGAFSLNLSSNDDVVLEIGQARDLGHCKILRKDGKECGAWLDGSKTEICEWHLNAQLDKTRAKRMGVNTGTNGFGGGGGGNRGGSVAKGKNGLQPPKDGHRFDRFTGSHFYITGGGGRAVSGGTGGPSIPEGNLSRDRGERVRKHLAAQVKEREIAEKLGSAGHGAGFGAGSAGAQYLKIRATKKPDNDGTADTKRDRKQGRPPYPRTREDTPPESAPGVSRRSSNLVMSDLPSSALVNGRKRTAADVRLSPVKKTRFVTDKGIREAGRESLGVATPSGGDDGESEDDLEIV